MRFADVKIIPTEDGTLAFDLGEFLNNLPFMNQIRRNQDNEIEGMPRYDQRGYEGDPYAPRFFDDYSRPLDRPNTLRDPRNPSGPMKSPGGEHFQYSVPMPGPARPVLADGGINMRDVGYPVETENPNVLRMYDNYGMPTYTEQEKYEFMLSPRGGITQALPSFISTS